MCWKELKTAEKDRTENRKAEEDGGLDNKIMAQLDSIGELIKSFKKFILLLKIFSNE